MEILRNILTVIFIFDCAVLVVLVLMQEGKSAGLGAIGGGSSDTYWGKNKGRSREAKLARWTKILAILFIVLAAVLNINRF